MRVRWWWLLVVAAGVGGILLYYTSYYTLYYSNTCCPISNRIHLVITDVHLSSTGAFSAAVKNDGTMPVTSLSYEISGLLPRTNSSVTAAAPLQPGQTILLTQGLTNVAAGQTYTVRVSAKSTDAGSLTAELDVVASV